MFSFIGIGEAVLESLVGFVVSGLDFTDEAVD